MEKVKKFWKWLWKSDSLASLVVLLILAYIVIKFIFFPLIAFITGSPLPLLIVESCSMNHAGFFDFNDWWQSHGNWYTERDFTKEQIKGFRYDWGMKMGDIVFLWNRGRVDIGDVIVFNSGDGHPIIHRVIGINEDGSYQTKGDANSAQLTSINNVNHVDETHILESQIIGKSVFRIPRIGWVKLGIVKIFDIIRGIPQEPWC